MEANADFLVPPREQFSARRRQRRQELRQRLLQCLWQLSCVSAIAGGMVWMITLPQWVLRDSSQIKVEGNRLFSRETIQKLVPLSYPTSLLQVQPHAIAQALRVSAPLSSVSVRRTLFPPQLTIEVRERSPVAVSRQNNRDGGIDADGLWMALDSYPAGISLPALRVQGNPAWLAKQWPLLYRQLQHSPIAVREVDWRDPGNLIVVTEIAKFHCGAYTESMFSRQLEIIDRLRNARSQLAEAAYIDITNPQAPVLEMAENLDASSRNSAPDS